MGEKELGEVDCEWGREETGELSGEVGEAGGNAEAEGHGSGERKAKRSEPEPNSGNWAGPA